MGTTGGFSVVGVDDRDVCEAESFARRVEKSGETSFRRKVKTVDVRVAGVEAKAEWNVEIFGSELLDDGEFGKIATELRAGASGVFEEEREPRIRLESVVDGSPSQGNSFGNVEHTLFEGKALVIARMNNQVFGAYNKTAFDLAAEGVKGVFADGGWRSREIDEITGVDDKRDEVVLGALGGEELDLEFVGRFGTPHARTSGENL